MKNLFKLIFVFGFISFMSGQASAQSYQAGENYIHVGIGFPSLVTTSVSGLSGASTSSMPPISAAFEHAIDKNFSIGGMFAYTSYKASYNFQDINPNPPFNSETYSESWKFTYMIIAARGSYHFATSEKFDPYVGVDLGYKIGSSTYTNTDPNFTALGIAIPTVTASGGFFGVHVGANYYFSDKIGVYGELGYDLALINIGLNVKL